VAAKPNWIEEEFQRRAQPSAETLDETAREVHFQKAAQATWDRLVSDLKGDLQEFNREAGGAEFSHSGPLGLRVSRARLTLVVTADLANHIIRYDYQSDDTRATAAPEGGMFSLRPSRFGRVDIYSADERLTDEETRRMLLEPVLFPDLPGTDASGAPLTSA
jgi:hypothetical protein